MNSLHSNRPWAASGFTLIEMLVTITIMLLLVGGGIASYISFNDRQILNTSGNRVEVLLRTAQKKARVGDKPTGCVRLQSYNVVTSAGGSRVTLRAQCSDQTYTVSQEDLPSAVTFVNAHSIRFGVLSGGVQNAGTIQMQSGTNTLELEVSEGGSVINKGIIDS